MESSPKRDPEATRQTILEAAEVLILEKGFSGTSVAEIARRAGVTKSLIHHHFGSKEQLWGAVKMNRFAEYHGRQIAMLRSYESGETLLRDSMVAYFRFLEANPEFVRLITWISLERDAPCPPEQGELYTLAIQRLQESQQQGLLRQDLPAPFILMSFLSLIQGWFRENRAPELALMGLELSPALNDQYLEFVLKLFFEGIAPR